MPEDRVVYIGNGVPFEAFGLPPNPNLRAELGLDAEDKVVGFIKSLRWIPLSLLGGGKRRFAEGEPGCCSYELHELCQEQISQRRRQAPTLRKNGCSVAPCVRRYLWRDTALHQTAT